jgi:RNA recognition motif-containing protein
MVSRLDQLPVLVLPDENHLVHVTCVSNKATEDDLKRFFSFCGFVRSVDLQPDERTSKKQAFVNFWDENAVDTALLLNGALLHDSPLSVARPLLDLTLTEGIFPSISSNEILSESKYLKFPRRLWRPPKAA